MSYAAAFSYFLLLRAHYSSSLSILSFSPSSPRSPGGFNLPPCSSEGPPAAGRIRGRRWCLCATAAPRGAASSDALPTSYTNSHYHNTVQRLASSHQILQGGLQVGACMFMGGVDSQSCTSPGADCSFIQMGLVLQTGKCLRRSIQVPPKPSNAPPALQLTQDSTKEHLALPRLLVRGGKAIELLVT